jgi:hypothetical protein
VHFWLHWLVLVTSGYIWLLGLLFGNLRLPQVRLFTLVTFGYFYLLLATLVTSVRFVYFWYLVVSSV